MEQLSLIPRNDSARMAAGESGKAGSTHPDRTPPVTTGQCGQVLNVVRNKPGIISLVITADMAVPECAARIHDLRAAGWNIITTIRPVVMFRGVELRNVASYSLGVPEWPAPGLFEVVAK